MQKTQVLKTTLMVTVISVLAIIGGYSANYILEKDRAFSGPSLGGEFTLMSAAGPVSLSDLSGQLVPMYFGYTYCPDACPTSLTLIAAAMNELESELSEKITPVLVSVDPDRDNLEHLADYTAYFHPRMLGLTGSREQIDQVVKQYGAIYVLHKTSAEDQDYLVDHSSRIYLLDSTGRLLALLPVGVGLQELVETMRDALNSI